VHSGWKGKNVSRDVWEHIDGKDITVKALFRAYDNYGESFSDYVDYIKTRTMPDGTLRYKAALDVKDDWKKYIVEVAKAGYATDPNYANQVILCVSSYMVEIIE